MLCFPIKYEKIIGKLNQNREQDLSYRVISCTDYKRTGMERETTEGLILFKSSIISDKI